MGTRERGNKGTWKRGNEGTTLQGKKEKRKESKLVSFFRLISI